MSNTKPHLKLFIIKTVQETDFEPYITYKAFCGQAQPEKALTQFGYEYTLEQAEKRVAEFRSKLGEWVDGPTVYLESYIGYPEGF